jgi:hypothetical protein
VQTVRLELDLATVLMTKKGCSGVAGGTSRRWQCHPRDRLGLGRWVVAVAVNLTLCALAPTSYLWRCATGAHQPSMGWAPPIRAQVKGPVSRWANWWRSIPTEPAMSLSTSH